MLYIHDHLNNSQSNSNQSTTFNQQTQKKTQQRQRKKHKKYSHTQMRFHQSIAFRNLVSTTSSSPGIVVLELQRIRNMRSILDIKISPKSTLLDSRKIRKQHRIDKPKPPSSDQNPQNSPGKDLSDCMVTQINPRVHSQHSQSPMQNV